MRVRQRWSTILALEDNHPVTLKTLIFVFVLSRFIILEWTRRITSTLNLPIDTVHNIFIKVSNMQKVCAWLILKVLNFYTTLKIVRSELNWPFFPVKVYTHRFYRNVISLDQLNNFSALTGFKRFIIDSCVFNSESNIGTLNWITLNNIFRNINLLPEDATK